jgi:hypothetical protein
VNQYNLALALMREGRIELAALDDEHTPIDEHRLAPFGCVRSCKWAMRLLVQLG